MNNATKTMIQNWVRQHNGDIESVARWMRDNLNISLRAAREAINNSVEQS